MSVHSESNPPGAIPHFPFQECSAGEVMGGGPPPPGLGKQGQPRLPEDFTTLRAALDAAVQALRSFHDYVGVLEQQQQRQVQAAAVLVPPAASVRPAIAPPPAVADPQPLQVPMLPPRQSFPVGQFETGVPPRAVLTPAQQAQLDSALAIAFAVEPAPAPPPAPVAPPAVAALAVPAAVLPAPPMSQDMSAMWSQQMSQAMPPVLVKSPAPPPVFALVSPPPMAVAPAVAVEPPAPRIPDFPPHSPFAMAVPAAGREAALMPGALPASPALMAAAPPLPGTFTPPAGMPAAPVPFQLPVLAPVVPAPMPLPPAALAGATGTMLPFSPFQGLEPAPPPPAADAVIRPEGADASWPTSPFFGSAQAATAPFRMVEPPPVVASIHAEPVPAPPAGSPASSFPPVPDQGQVFNFAELLRANGQR